MRGREKVYYDFRSTPVVLVLALEDEAPRFPMSSSSLPCLYHHVQHLSLLSLYLISLSIPSSSRNINSSKFTISSSCKSQNQGCNISQPGDSKCLCLEILNALTQLHAASNILRKICMYNTRPYPHHSIINNPVATLRPSLPFLPIDVASFEISPCRLLHMY